MRACHDLLALLGIPHFRVNQRPVQRRDGTWSSPGADRGAADLIGTLAPHGRALFVECKTGDARRTREQQAWADAWEAAGALVVLVRSVDDLRAALPLTFRRARS